jgi:hypothetical protein
VHLAVFDQGSNTNLGGVVLDLMTWHMECPFTLEKTIPIYRTILGDELEEVGFLRVCLKISTFTAAREKEIYSPLRKSGSSSLSPSSPTQAHAASSLGSAASSSDLRLSHNDSLTDLNLTSESLGASVTASRRQQLNKQQTQRELESIITTLSAPTEHSSSQSEVRKILAEIKDSEETYVNDLVLISQKFIQPIEAMVKTPFLRPMVINPNFIFKIFGNWPDILKTNSAILDDLKNFVFNNSEISLEDAIIRVCNAFTRREAQFRAVYTTHCCNQEEALHFVQEFTQEEEFGTVCRALLSHSDFRKLQLDSFVVKPMQRLTKYPLLMRELSKNVTEQSTITKINECMEMFKNVAININKLLRDRERLKVYKQALGVF